ncbi:shadow of prion protein [Carettochelys insculpta]|uniref:shadow of prion protein n=1 Tax=Carettochelys insculpta TaxID=44489 RepID=UPI003EBCF9CD
MKRRTATCWTFLLLAAFFCDGISCKGGRGGARGAARGGARGMARSRSKAAPRYGPSGAALRVAAAAAAGAAAGVAARAAERRVRGSGELGLDDGAEFQEGNRTGSGVYSYRSWTSAAGAWDAAHLALPFCLVPGFLRLLPL